MVKKSIRIKLTSLREASDDSFFGQFLDGELMDEPLEDEPAEEEEQGPIEMFSEGELYVTHTQVRFERSQPGLVTMMRHGTVNTILVFEKGKRHICTYQTEYMPFEICVLTKEVRNTLLTNGRIELDYIVEIRGAQAERTQFTIEIFEN